MRTKCSTLAVAHRGRECCVNPCNKKNRRSYFRLLACYMNSVEIEISENKIHDPLPVASADIGKSV